jgi:hypothetical protein
MRNADVDHSFLQIFIVIFENSYFEVDSTVCCLKQEIFLDEVSSLV